MSNYGGTDTTSVAAATNLLETVNNTTTAGETATTAFASDGNANNGLVVFAAMQGANATPASIDLSFVEEFDAETGGGEAGNGDCPGTENSSPAAASLCSYAYFATHLHPLPHISASDPSALNMRMRTSAMSDGPTMISPSLPIPKCRSLTACDRVTGSSIFSSKQLT